MTISFRVLGTAGRDNALLVQIDSGQAVERLLFDCGEGCLNELSLADIKAVDHLFFSHLHMDHVAGFDSFFRCNLDRDVGPRIWGPPETTGILHHRFQGFLWNLHGEMSGTWRVSDVHSEEIHTVRYELSEAFAVAHDKGTQLRERSLCEGVGFEVETFTMDHRTPTLAYLVREKTRVNVDTTRMAQLGLRPGPWLKQLKESAGGTVNIDGTAHSLDDFRQELIIETAGDSTAYLTDFLLDDIALDQLSNALHGCRIIVCEGQYRHADMELARKHFHMTTVQSATLAQRVQAEKLILIHLSDRYDQTDWIEMLQEARGVFPNTNYPARWNLEPGN